MSRRAGSTGPLARTQAVPACGGEKALLAKRRMRGSTVLSWATIDAIPGWFMFQSYYVWRALLDQQARVAGGPGETGRWPRPPARRLRLQRHRPQQLLP